MSKKHKVDLLAKSYIHVKGLGNVPLEVFPTHLKITTSSGTYAPHNFPKTLSLKTDERGIAVIVEKMRKLGLKLIDASCKTRGVATTDVPKWTPPPEHLKAKRCDDRWFYIPGYHPQPDPLCQCSVRVDKYRNFTELSMAETEYKIEYRITDSPKLVLAVHGGNMEPGTTEVADAVANSYLNYYSFVSDKELDNSDMHITSSVYDEPMARTMAKQAKTVLSFHGAAGSEVVVYLGGRDIALGDRVARNLIKAGFAVATNLDPGLCGQDKGNIVNSGKTGAGVQFEISRGLRDLFFEDGMSSRQITTDTFKRFVEAIKRCV